MEKKWTDDQKRIIDTRTGNLLVSAAAGSGKTAVLVERIIRLVTDEKNPIDIDRLVIMTFTRAAAAQMREKIGNELEKRIQQDPDSKELRRQQKLLGNTVISTIDSFCIGLVHDYFHVLELDPSFRVADDAEVQLIKSDCMDALMEDWYAKLAEAENSDSSVTEEASDIGEEPAFGFRQLRESYGTHKNDDKLTGIVMKMADKALSTPWPDEWLQAIEDDYSVTSVKEFNSTKVAEYIVQYTKQLFETLQPGINKAVEICNMTDGPVTYLPMVAEIIGLIGRIQAAKDYLDLNEIFNTWKFSQMSRKAGPDEDLNQRVKTIRENFKTIFNDTKAQFFYSDIESIINIIVKSRPVVSCLVALTRDYLERFSAMKRSMNVIDFNDAEHLALEILTVKTECGHDRSEVARELQKRYAEIIIDEYQDSNEIQEEIANAIAGDSAERPYIFTVGDVKQSIYKFRNACPELFVKKQDMYAEGIGNGKLIFLDRNFRSREEILEATNAVFKNAMHRSLGGIEYTDEVSLKSGTEAQHMTSEPSPYRTELLLVEPESASEEDAEAGKQRIEAREVARRIKKLVCEEKLPIRTEENGEEVIRPVNYGDIVILLRTMKDWSDVFCEVLEEEGVPAFSDSQKGFFFAEETMLTLNYLRILDNPRDDIALTSVLYSFIGGLDENELAEIKIAGQAAAVPGAQAPDFYDCLLAAYQMELPLKAKLEPFFETYNYLYAMKNEVTTPELISEIYDRTGLYSYFSATVDGERRKGNLDILLGHAAKYEETGYSGLFSFMRYVDKLKGHELDYGEAGNEIIGDSVRLMSIHKSKGLEFPVVILSGLGKKFNKKDIEGDVIINSAHGLGLKYVDPEERIKYPGFYQNVIKVKGTEDIIGEEMRLLYVAMTRAKEKLIMTGICDKPETDISYAALLDSNHLIDFVYPTVQQSDEYISLTVISAEETDGETAEDTAEENAEKTVEEITETAEEKISEKTAEESEEKAVEETAETTEEKISEKASEEIEEKAEGEIPEGTDAAVSELLRIRDLKYPYEAGETVPVKLSVSDLKHQAIEEEEGENPFQETRGFTPGGEKTLPSFMKQEAEENGQGVFRATDYGTLMHKIMQFIPMKLKTAGQVSEYLEEMKNSGIISETERNALNAGKFSAFLNTELADRIRRAEKQGCFYREKQFMLGMRACDIDGKKYDGREELVPVQGVIDAMIVEADGIVILDYKTDSIAPGEEQQLAERYRVQLECYAQAAERLMGKKVKEKLLYSFKLGEIISV